MEGAMRIKGDYLSNLPALLDQWADDIDRLDMSIQTNEPIRHFTVEVLASNQDAYEIPEPAGVAV
jgi:hypothetical protein